MKIFTWSKFGLVAVALFLTGQSCSINIGTGSRLDGGVYRSDDHGKTWVQKNFVRSEKKRQVNLDDVTVRTMAFDPTTEGHIYLGTLANGIWVTTNGGDQWQPTSLRSGAYECISFDPLNPQVMYTAAGQVIMKSVDAGQTWKTVYTESQPGQALTCVIVNPNADREVYGITSGGKILMSEDYGQRWTLMGLVPALLPRQILVTPDNVMYIFSRTNGIFVSTNRGTSWTDISAPLQKIVGAMDIRAVTIRGNDWYIATANGPLLSTDRGTSWKQISTVVTSGSVPVQSVAVNPRNNLEIFLTTDQKLHHTIDGGASWTVVPLPTGRLPVVMTFDPLVQDRLYFGTFKQPKK